MRVAGGEIEVLCRMELSIPTLCDAFPEFYLHKQESDNLWPTPESIQYQQDLLISRKQQQNAHDRGNNSCAIKGESAKKK